MFTGSIRDRLAEWTDTKRRDTKTWQITGRAALDETNPGALAQAGTDAVYNYLVASGVYSELLEKKTPIVSGVSSDAKTRVLLIEEKEQ